MKKNYEGHRERLKDRFLKEGLDNFAEHNALELILFFAIPQKDVKDLAHSLLGKFGSLSGIMDAAFEDLCSVPGIGKNSATLLKLLPQVFRRYEISRQAADVLIDSTEKAGDYLMPRFVGVSNEIVICMCLNARNRITACELISQGTVNMAHLHTRYVIELAITHKATSVILAHNHPSGIALPSQEDHIVTLKVEAALRSAGIVLRDHLVVADGDYVSMRQSNMLGRTDSGIFNISGVRERTEDG